MGFLSTLIKPEIAINLIRKQLEKHTGKKIEKFTILFKSNSDTIIFIVDKNEFDYTDNNLRQLILSKVKSYIKKDQTLDFVKIECDKTIDAYLYYTDEHKEKQFINYKF